MLGQPDKVLIACLYLRFEVKQGAQKDIKTLLFPMGKLICYIAITNNWMLYDGHYKIWTSKNIVTLQSGWWFGCHFLFSHIVGISNHPN